jgi:hypothetical protein
VVLGAGGLAGSQPMESPNPQTTNNPSNFFISSSLLYIVEPKIYRETKVLFANPMNPLAGSG